MYTAFGFIMQVEFFKVKLLLFTIHLLLAY